jgi:ribosome-binding factor A
MAKHRRGRINDEVVKEISSILREVKDPRVSGAFISITAAEVTPDLKFAKIYYSLLTGNEKDVAKGLVSSTGYIRRCLAQSLNLRITPELTFVRDGSIAHGAHISELLHKIEQDKPKAEPEDAEETEEVEETEEN